MKGIRTMQELISKREFARREGCDEKLIRVAVAQGRLKADKAGKLDAAQVGTGWRRPKGPARGSADTSSPQRSAASAQPDESPSQAAKRIAGETDPPPYADSLARKEHYLSLLRRLEYEQKSGELIPMAEAKNVLFLSGRASRDHWANFVPRFAALIASDLGIEADKVTAVLSGYMHKHQVALADPDGKTLEASA